MSYKFTVLPIRFYEKKKKDKQITNLFSTDDSQETEVVFDPFLCFDIKNDSLQHQ